MCVAISLSLDLHGRRMKQRNNELAELKQFLFVKRNKQIWHHLPSTKFRLHKSQRFFNWYHCSRDTDDDLLTSHCTICYTSFFAFSIQSTSVSHNRQKFKSDFFKFHFFSFLRPNYPINRDRATQCRYQIGNSQSGAHIFR